MHTFFVYAPAADTPVATLHVNTLTDAIDTFDALHMSDDVYLLDIEPVKRAHRVHAIIDNYGTEYQFAQIA